MEKKETTKKKFTNLIKTALNHSSSLEGELDYLRLNKIRLSISSSPKDDPPSRPVSPKEDAMLKNNSSTKTKQENYENHKKERALKILEELTQETTDSEMSDTYTTGSADSISPTFSLSNIFQEQKLGLKPAKSTRRSKSKSPRQITPRELLKKKISWNSSTMNKTMEEVLNEDKFYGNETLSKSSPALFIQSETNGKTKKLK
eukprot:gene3129-5445_t